MTTKIVAEKTVWLAADGKTPLVEEKPGEVPEGAATLLVRKGGMIAQDAARQFGLAEEITVEKVTGLTTLELVSRAVQREKLSDEETAQQERTDQMAAAALLRRQGAPDRDANVRRQSRIAAQAELGGTDAIGTQDGTIAGSLLPKASPESGGQQPDPEKEKSKMISHPAASAATDGAKAQAATGAQASGSKDLDNDGRDEAGADGSKKGLTAPPVTKQLPTQQPPKQAPPPPTPQTAAPGQTTQPAPQTGQAGQATTQGQSVPSAPTPTPTPGNQ